jgi:hypothetical protein
MAKQNELNETQSKRGSTSLSLLGFMAGVLFYLVIR